jgi:hypothetical protein
VDGHHTNVFPYLEFKFADLNRDKELMDYRSGKEQVENSIQNNSTDESDSRNSASSNEESSSHSSTNESEGTKVIPVMCQPEKDKNGKTMFKDDVVLEQDPEYDQVLELDEDDLLSIAYNIPDDEANFVPQVGEYATEDSTAAPKLGVDTSMYDKFWSYSNSYLQTGSRFELSHKVDRHNAHSFRLLKLMQLAKTPMEYMSAFLSWAEHGAREGVYGTNVSPPKREQAIKNASKIFDTEGWNPINHRVRLPNSKQEVDVVTFDFMEMVRSLLTDPEIACDENFLFPDGESPMSSPACRWEDVDPKTHRLSDLTSGRWYHETYYLKCHGKEGHVLLPIILYSDKTHTDQRGNLCQEPVLFTLGIFNKRTRQLPRAWRPLGFVPNMQILNQSIKSTQKIDDYHRCLDIILAGLEKAQSHEGLKWDFF